MRLDGEVESGRLANPDAVLWVRESTIAAGPATGTRAIDVQVWDGLAGRIYPDRGLDLGQFWYRGTPLAWVSRVGEAPPLREPKGMAWGEAFGGGLMTTCGLRNVGFPSEGHGLHGTFSHLPATSVVVERSVAGEEAQVIIAGVVDDPVPPAHLRVERELRFPAGAGRIEIGDTTTNLGDAPAPAPLLYHFNLGFPLWAPPAELEIPGAATVARDPASEEAVEVWRRPPSVAAGPEWVLEHALPADLEWGSARVVNPRLGLALTLRWHRAALPRLNQWLDRNPGMAVLGIEPANCTTRGRAYERASGSLPMLQPGQRRTTSLQVEVETL